MRKFMFSTIFAFVTVCCITSCHKGAQGTQGNDSIATDSAIVDSVDSTASDSLPDTLKLDSVQK